MNTTSVEITAGLGGFLVLFGLMVVVWFLGRDMTRRLRRMRLAEDERVARVRRERDEQRRLEQADREQAGKDQDEQDERDDPIG